REARRPVIVAGRGVQLDPDPVRRLAEHHGVGVYAAFRRQDAFPNGHPLYLGHLGIAAPDALLGPLREADLVLVLGCRLSEVTTQSYALPAGDTYVVQADPEPDAAADLAVPCDPGAFAEAVTIGPGTARDWSAAHAAWERLNAPPAPDAPNAPDAAGGVHPAAVLAAMRRRLPSGAVLVNDAGNFAIFVHRHWRFDHPHTQLAPTSGAMGYAVPASVGAALVTGRPVVAAVGDGGFLMSGQELETAARYGLSTLTVVFQNRLYGTIALHQARASGRPAAVDIGDVDLAGYARSLGADAVTVDAADQLDDALAVPPAGGPRVVVVRTDPDVLSPTATLSGLLGDQRR
ncbi:MAG TPA: thiamine pyrophosphate-dependent enzyme, partial [Pseudonocardiaceae bacterium]